MPAQKGKKHWTKRMSKEEVRKRLAEGRKKAKTAKQNGASGNEQEIVAYAFGRVEAILEGLAVGAGIPPAVLTSRVARLLDSKTRGQLLGS